MAYQIFRMEKVRRQGVGGCQAEHNRTEKDVGRFPDSEIDYTKTKDNEYLIKSKNYWEDIQKTLNKHGIEKWRKDAVVMIDAIYTASPEAMAAMSEEERMQYFVECAEWHQEHFGPVINAVIHKDETTWHMHIDSVPLLQKDDGSFRLCAKDMFGNRAKMASLQTDLYEKVSKYYNLERGETRNPDEMRNHKTKLEHDIEQLSEKKEQIENQVSTAKEKAISKAKSEIEQKTREAEAKAQARIREADKKAKVAEEQAQTFQEGAERRLNEMQAIDVELTAKKGELSQITGEARAQALAEREKALKRYKKAPLSKDMYLVPEDDIVAFENMGNTQRQLNEKAKVLDEKEKSVKKREQEADRAYKRYQEYPGLCQKLIEKESNLDAEIHREAVSIFERNYEGALIKMGLWEQVVAFIKKEKQLHKSKGIGL